MMIDPSAMSDAEQELYFRANLDGLKRFYGVDDSSLMAEVLSLNDRDFLYYTLYRMRVHGVDLPWEVNQETSQDEIQTDIAPEPKPRKRLGWFPELKNYQHDARCYQSARRAIALDLPYEFTPDEWAYCLEYFGNRCAFCGNQQGLWNPLCIEHVINLMHPASPGNIAANIVPACRDCNSSKGTKSLDVWLREKWGPKRVEGILARITAYFEHIPARARRTDPAARR